MKTNFTFVYEPLFRSHGCYVQQKKHMHNVFIFIYISKHEKYSSV